MQRLDNAMQLYHDKAMKLQVVLLGVLYLLCSTQGSHSPAIETLVHGAHSAPEHFSHVHSVQLDDTGFKEDPWRVGVQKGRRLEELGSDGFPLPSTARTPPFGKHVFFSMAVEGRVNATFNKVKLKHHRNLVHEDAVLEFHDNGGSPRTVPFPNSVYHAKDDDGKRWIYLSMITQDRFKVWIHDHGQTIVVEPTQHIQKYPHHSRRRLKGFFDAHERKFGAFPKLLAYESNQFTAKQGECRRKLGSERWDNWKTRTDEKSAKPVSPTSNLGPYTPLDCGLTSLHIMQIGYGVDTGFFKRITGDTGTGSAEAYLEVAAEVAIMTALINPPYIQQFNVFLQIKYINAFHSTASGPSWNDEPLNWAQASGSTLRTYGCKHSRNGEGSSQYLQKIASWGSANIESTPCKNCGSFQVFTACYKPSGVMGIAFVGVVCKKSHFYGMNSYYTHGKQTMGTLAHELGHTFGAGHSTRGVMDYTTFDELRFWNEKWSGQTNNYADMCRAINSGKNGGRGRVTNCFLPLTNVGPSYTDRCGNSVVEEGEECDGGDCCTDKCKLKAAAQCDTTFTIMKKDGTHEEINDGCCTDQCKFELPTQQCNIMPTIHSNDVRVGVCMNGECRDFCKAPAKTGYRLYVNQCPSTILDPCKLRCASGSISSQNACKDGKEVNANIAEFLPAGTVCGVTPVLQRCSGTGKCCPDCQNGGAAITDANEHCACSCAEGFSGNNCENDDGGGSSPSPGPSLPPWVLINAPIKDAKWNVGAKNRPVPEIHQVLWQSGNVGSGTFTIEIELKVSGSVYKKATSLTSDAKDTGIYQIDLDALSDDLNTCGPYRIKMQLNSEGGASFYSQDFTIMPASEAVVSITLKNMDNGLGTTTLIKNGRTQITATRSCKDSSSFTVGFDLYRNGSKVKEINRVSGRNQNYVSQEWTVPIDLPVGSSHTILVKWSGLPAKHSEVVDVSTPSTPATVLVTVPKPFWVIDVVDDATIMWSTTGPIYYVNVDVCRVSDGVVMKSVGSNVPAAQGSIKFSVSNSDLPEKSKGYFARVSKADDSNVKGDSPPISTKPPPTGLEFTLTKITVSEQCLESSAPYIISWRATNAPKGEEVEIAYTREGTKIATVMARGVSATSLFHVFSAPVDIRPASYSFTVRSMLVPDEIYGTTSSFVTMRRELTVSILDQPDWHHGASALLQWTVTGCPLAKTLEMDVYLVDNIGNVVALLKHNLEIAAVGQGELKIDSVSSQWPGGKSYMVKVRNKANGRFWTSSKFMINAAEALEIKSITLPTEHSGKVVLAWKTEGYVPDVNIEIFKDGSLYKTLASLWPNAGKFMFSTKQYPSSSQYRVKIAGMGTTKPAAAISDPFALNEGSDLSIKVLKPEFGRSYLAGETIGITYETKGGTGSGNVFVDVYLCDADGSTKLMNIFTKSQSPKNQKAVKQFSLPQNGSYLSASIGFRICIEKWQGNSGTSFNQNVKGAEHASQMFYIEALPSIEIASVTFTNIGEYMFIKWRSTGMPVRTLDIYLENVMGGEAGGTKHTLAADLQNIDQVRVLVPANSGIKNETDYTLRIEIRVPPSKIDTKTFSHSMLIRFASSSTHLSPKVLQPVASSAVSSSENLIIEWQASEGAAFATVTMEQFGTATRNSLLTTLASSAASTGYLKIDLFSHSVIPNLRNVVQVKISDKNSQVIHELTSEVFSITEPEAKVEIISVSGGERAGLLPYKIVFGRPFDFLWSIQGNVGSVALELWECETAGCYNSEFAMSIDSVDSSNYLNKSKHELKTSWTPSSWTQPPKVDGFYRVVVRSIQYSNKYFATSPEILTVSPNICIIGEGGCSNVQIRLLVDSPTQDQVVMTGSLVHINWKIIVSNPNEWRPPTYVSISLRRNGKHVLTIAPEVENTGSYAWPVSEALEGNDKYSVIVKAVTVSGSSKAVACPNTNAAQDGSCQSGLFRVRSLNTAGAIRELFLTLEQENRDDSSGWSPVSDGSALHTNVVSVGQFLRVSWFSVGSVRGPFTIAIVDSNNAVLALWEDIVEVAGTLRFRIPSSILPKLKNDVYRIRIQSSNRALRFSKGFYIVSRKSLNVLPRTNMVRGSTFFFEWSQPEKPFMLRSRFVRRAFIEGFSGSSKRRSRQLSSSEGKIMWKTARGVSCVPFIWENTMQNQCVSGVKPTKFDGQPWCATAVNKGGEPIATGVCPQLEVFEVQPGKASADSKVLDTNTGYVRVTLPGGSALPGAGDGYYMEMFDGNTGNVVARSNSFSIACSPFEIQFEYEAVNSSLSQCHQQIIDSTGFSKDKVKLTKQDGAQATVWLLTGGLEDTDFSNCPEQKLSTISKLPCVHQSSFSFKTLDLYSEAPPQPESKRNQNAEDNTLLIVGISIGAMVLIGIVLGAYYIRSHREQLQKMYGKWKTAKLTSKTVYYVKPSTGETSWLPSFFADKQQREEDSTPNKEVANKEVVNKEVAGLSLPEGWHEGKADDGRVFYFHDDGESTSWELPQGQPKKTAKQIDAAKLPPGWHKDIAAAGRIYYWHDDGKTTSWELPDWIPEGWGLNPGANTGTPGTLAKGWKKVEIGGNGKEIHYHYNEETCQSSWENPQQKQERKKPAIATKKGDWL